LDIERLPSNPIIGIGVVDDPKSGKPNVNGPSLIKVPSWMPNRLGNYYLYFAHHRGSYIRMAYADNVEGPYKLHDAGTLHLAHAIGCFDHIASPDVHVDEDKMQIKMFFHGVDRGTKKQLSYLSVSTDGVSFVACKHPVADFYLRVVKWNDCWLGMSKGGVMYLSKDGISDFQRLPCKVFPMGDSRANSHGDIRHVALKIEGKQLLVFYSRIGDAPESIYRAVIDLSLPTDQWVAKKQLLVLAPESSYEGIGISLQASKAGPAYDVKREVRDPAIFVDGSEEYLLYSVAGEQGIAIARVLGR
jgi:hypothetical protein